MDHFVRTRTTLRHILIGVSVFLTINVMVIFLAQGFVPYNTKGYPYKDFVDQYNLPILLQPLANFDGAQYLIIAADKYFTYQQAYFPLYPLFIRLSAPLYMHNYAVAGIVLSLVSFVGGLLTLHKLAEFIYPETNPKQQPLHPAILLLLALPCSFFFSAIYTESLFLLLAVGTMYCVFRRRPIVAGFLGYLASLTRFAGILLLLPIGVELLFHHKKYSAKQMAILLMGPLAGLLTYMVYLYLTTHDALAFIHAQAAFSNNRSTSAVFLPQVLYRYLKIFSTANLDMAYVVATLEFAVFVVYFGLLSVGLWNMLKGRVWEHPHGPPAIGVLLFSFANLILPTLTGTLGSIPRYSLLSIAILPLVLKMRPLIRWTFITISIALHMILFALFAQGWFVG